MKLNIFSKLFFATLLATLILTLFMVLFMNWSFRSGFEEYHHQRELERVELLAENLGDAYQDAGSWDALLQHPRVWRQLLREVGVRLPRNQRRSRPPRFERDFERGFDRNVEHRRPPPPRPEQANRNSVRERPLAARLSLLDQQGNVLINQRLQQPYTHQVPIAAGDAVVGYLGVRQGNIRGNQLANSFLSQQLRNLYLVALVAALVSLLTAVLLVRHFLRPVKLLTKGADALTAGRFDSRIEAATQDELGQLATRFNALAETLQHNEQARSRWITDISHELRTPIAVLRSEIEAIQDGVRKPDQQRIASLHSEVLALGKLVDDLHQLSLSDAGDWVLERCPVELVALVNDSVDAVEARFQEKSLTLQTNMAPDAVWVEGDDKRLRQLLCNLLENSYRYTDVEGVVEVGVAVDAAQVAITVQDSHPGVPDESLPRLFDRLYRVDRSRNRALGGSGLGLSICKNIVEGHGGVIEAQHAPLGGLLVRIVLPLAEKQDE